MAVAVIYMLQRLRRGLQLALHGDGPLFAVLVVSPAAVVSRLLRAHLQVFGCSGPTGYIRPANGKYQIAATATDFITIFSLISNHAHSVARVILRRTAEIQTNCIFGVSTP